MYESGTCRPLDEILTRERRTMELESTADMRGSTLALVLFDIANTYAYKYFYIEVSVCDESVNRQLVKWTPRAIQLSKHTQEALSPRQSLEAIAYNRMHLGPF